MSARDTAAQFGLAEIQDPRVTVYQTRADYETKTGKKAPVYNPDLPTKHWALDVPAGVKTVTYSVAQIVDEAPQIVAMTMPASLARSVNIPAGEANAEERYSTEWADLPIQPLRPEEYLGTTFAGIIVVRNRGKFAEPVTGFEQQVIAKLNAIAAKLGI